MFLVISRNERACLISIVHLITTLSLGVFLLLSNTSIVSAQSDKFKGRQKKWVKFAAKEKRRIRRKTQYYAYNRCESTFKLKNDNAILVFNKFDYSGTIDSKAHVLCFPDMEDDDDKQKVDYCKDKVKKLDHDDFPLTQSKKEVVDCLELSNAISVRTENDYTIKHCIADLMNGVNADPVFPEARTDAPFWKEMEEVVAMRKLDASSSAKDVLVGGGKMQLPDKWKDFTLDEMAKAVQGEPPCYWQGYVYRDILAGKYGPLIMDDQVMTWRGTSVEFIDGVIALSEICTWAVSHISNHNFAVKYKVGMPRPEEVAYAISIGEISKDHVPEKLYGDIMDFNLKHAVDFTAYPNGSPRHPSYPAMHSAASNLSFWLPVLFQLNPEQICEIRKMDYAVAYARTIAGVHYPQDNWVGLNLGQLVLRRALPRYLSEKFHGDIHYIIEKIKEVSFDWNDIDPANICA